MSDSPSRQMTRSEAEAAMLLAAAEDMGVRNIRRWHCEAPRASAVIQDAYERDNFSMGVAMIQDAVADFVESTACDDDAIRLANEVAEYCSRGGRWTPGDLCEAHNWKAGDKVELRRFLKHFATILEGE